MLKASCLTPVKLKTGFARTLLIYDAVDTFSFLTLGSYSAITFTLHISEFTVR